MIKGTAAGALLLKHTVAASIEDGRRSALSERRKSENAARMQRARVSFLASKNAMSRVVAGIDGAIAIGKHGLGTAGKAADNPSAPDEEDRFAAETGLDGPSAGEVDEASAPDEKPPSAPEADLEGASAGEVDEASAPDEREPSALEEDLNGLTRAFGRIEWWEGKVESFAMGELSKAAEGAARAASGSWGTARRSRDAESQADRKVLDALEQARSLA